MVPLTDSSGRDYVVVATEVIRQETGCLGGEKWLEHEITRNRVEGVDELFSYKVKTIHKVAHY